MHPEGLHAPHWYVIGSLLAVANDNPITPAISFSELHNALNESHLFSDDRYLSVLELEAAINDCINWGLITSTYEYRDKSLNLIAITPLGTHFITTDKEMRAGKQRKHFLALPEGADRAIYSVQMGNEELKKRSRFNPYRNLISLYALAVPAEEVLGQLDRAVEAVRASNSISSDLREEILAKLDEGRRKWTAGAITIALLSALIIQPLLSAWNAVMEEVLKDQISSAAEFIKEKTGI